MIHPARAALLAAVLTGLALPAAAQNDPASAVGPGGPTSMASLQNALSHLDRTSQSISGNRHIPQSTISLVNVHWAQLDRTTQSQLTSAMTTQREANLQTALGKAIVATENRPNGVSEDQVTLREYLISQSIDPKNVIAVDVAGDGDNAPVTVFYRGAAPGQSPTGG